MRISRRSDSSRIIHNHLRLGRNGVTDHAAVAVLIRFNNIIASCNVFLSGFGGEIAAGDEAGLVLTVNCVCAAVNRSKISTSYSNLHLCDAIGIIILRVALIQRGVAGNSAVGNIDNDRKFGGVLGNCQTCTIAGAAVAVGGNRCRGSRTGQRTAGHIQLASTDFHTSRTGDLAAVNVPFCITG